MKQLELSVSLRTQFGTAHSNRLRREGLIPAIMYGPGANMPLVITKHNLSQLMRQSGGSLALVQITDDQGKGYLAIIKAVQRHPTNDTFLHVDFLQVSEDQEITTLLPIHITGESVGVKNENAILENHLHQVEIRCLPKHLPEYINVDVTGLHAGQAIHIKDLPSIEGVSYLGNADVSVVSCVERRVSKEEESKEEETSSDASKPASTENKT